jgi:MFS transporter, PPP family, 3-phenylpropionic acid transporter
MWISGALLVLGGAVVPSLPKLAVAESSDRLRATMLRDGIILLRIPAYRRLLIAASLLWGSHAMHDSFSVIRWRSAGIDFFTISALWSESVFAEVLVFLLVGPWLVRRIGCNWSMMLATSAGVIRSGIAAFTTSPRVWACIQPLHGLTFALFHLAAIPAHRGSDAGQSCSDGAGNLRHAVRWLGDRAADRRVGPAFRCCTRGQSVGCYLNNAKSERLVNAGARLMPPFFHG